MLVVNLFAGPGAGKSTLAAGTFAWLKSRTTLRVELVTEFAKELTWAECHTEIAWQPRVLGEQSWRLARLDGKVDAVITDSPILLGCVYNKLLARPFVGYEVLAWDIHRRFRNMNVRVHRPERYETAGRNETKEEAELIDREVDAMMLLCRSAAPDLAVHGKDPGAPEAVARAVLERLGR
jgi:hypothetical protein